MTGLRISSDLTLPIDAVTQAIAILARKGMGKTYTASVLVEEVVKAKVPVVVIDPTGAYFGLRSSADGERAGLPVVIFGGDHGDVPLEPTAGRVIADVILEHPGAYVVDLSAFESRAAEIRFAAELFDRLYRGKKRETGPLLLVVDEADIFAPQRPGPEQTKTLGALEAIVRRGRIKGLGDLLITQRAAVLNKNCLTQTEILIVGQTTGPQDRAAIDDWIAGNGTREERDQVLGSLASLERGEVWVWSPSFLRILDRVRIRQRTTYDSSRTPEAGEATIVPRAFAPVDIEQLGARIAATVEQAKANDPVALRRRILELEREVGIVRETPAAVRVEQVVEYVDREVPVLNGQVPELRLAIGELVDAGQRLIEVATAVADAAAVVGSAAERLELVGASITSAIDRVAATPRPAAQPAMPADGSRRAHGAEGIPSSGNLAGQRTGAPRSGMPVKVLEAAASREAPAPAGGVGAPPPGKAERAFLEALARHPDGLSRIQLAILTGYSIKSSSIKNGLGALRTAGYVTKTGEPIRITEAGLEAAGDVPPAPTGAELREYWLSRLGAAERAFLEILVEAYPDPVTKEELAERSGYSITSSSIKNALGRLRSLGLVDGWTAHPGIVG